VHDEEAKPMASLKIAKTRTLSTALFIAGPVGGALIGGIATLLGGFAGLCIGLVVTAGIMAALLVYEAWDTQKKLQRIQQIKEPKAEGIPEDRTDKLTGLANENGLKAWFIEKTGRILEDNKAIMVISADLANYSQLVATRGQEQADAILKEAARRIASFTGSDGIAARTGTDEFAVIASVLPTQNIELVSDTAGKLTEMLQRPIEMPTGVVWIGGSVEAAMGKPNEAQQTLERARQALKRSKQLDVGHFYVDGLSTV
jgi:diguanylate cyclase (GGDEF)-like protein